MPDALAYKHSIFHLHNYIICLSHNRKHSILCHMWQKMHQTGEHVTFSNVVDDRRLIWLLLLVTHSTLVTMNFPISRREYYGLCFYWNNQREESPTENKYLKRNWLFVGCSGAVRMRIWEQKRIIIMIYQENYHQRCWHPKIQQTPNENNQNPWPNSRYR